MLKLEKHPEPVNAVSYNAQSIIFDKRKEVDQSDEHTLQGKSKLPPQKRIRPWPAVTQIHLDISGRCNLSCPLCYKPDDSGTKELSVAEIESIARDYRGYAFILGGREPTMRPDLTQIISSIRPYGSVMLLTNGLALTDRPYVDELMKAGLDGVILSFNGLKQHTYLELNGSECLNEKLKVLQILKSAAVPTVISMTVMDGVNTDQIGAVQRLCCENTDFIKELRIRAARPFGRHPANDMRTLDMSDLRQLFIDQVHIDPIKLNCGIDFWHSIGENFAVDAYRKRDCSLHFMLLQRNGIWQVEGEQISTSACRAVADWCKHRWLRPFYILVLLHQMVRIFGWCLVMRRIRDQGKDLLRFKPISHHSQLTDMQGKRNILSVTLKAWAVNTLTIKENQLCQTLFVSREESRPFCSFTASLPTEV
jgi:MoaA/NifB/PqqE/SkfB family radical SAM enzyme